MNKRINSSTTLVKPSSKELPELKPEKKHTAIGIHITSQLYGNNKSLSLFSPEKVEDFMTDTGLPITDKPTNYGVVLNQTQWKVFEGILKAFSDSNYLGDKQVERDEILGEIYNTGSQKALNKLSKPYGNITQIPVIKLTQAEIIQLAGYEKKRQGDKVDVVESIAFLSTKQFCFYWVRLKKDEKGRPIKDKSGDYAKEEVMEVGSLLRIKYVRQPGGELDYYEISPSSVVLDQVNKTYGGSYFLLVPNNWRDEVQKITGKRASSYTYEFLFWLRLQYEHIRRHNAAKDRKNPKRFLLKNTLEEIATAIKMPETMYKRNKTRAKKIILDAYSIAVKLEYLVKIESDGVSDILYLNESFYPQPGELL